MSSAYSIRFWYSVASPMIAIRHFARRAILSPPNFLSTRSYHPRPLNRSLHLSPTPGFCAVQPFRFNSTQPVKNCLNRPPKAPKAAREELNRSLKPIAKDFAPSDVTNTPLSRDIYTIPNLLTMTRIASTPFIGYFIASGQSTGAISLFTYLCITDFVDGYVARKYNLKTVFGSILDPLADKFLMTTCTLALYFGGGIPLYVASIIIGRDMMLSFMAFYMRYTSLPAPKTLRRYFDPKITTHTVLPNMLGKINTALQMVYVGGLVFLPGLKHILALPLDTIFSWYGVVVAGTTFASGCSYLFTRGTARLPVQ